MKHTFRIALILALTGLCLLGVSINAQNNDPPKAEPTIGEKLTVPENATVEELEKFVSEALVYMPRTIATYEVYLDFLAKQAEAVNKATDIILASENLSATSKNRALQAKIQTCLRNVRGEGRVKSLAVLQAIIDDVKDDEAMEAVAFSAQRACLTLRMAAFQTGENEDRNEFLQLDKDLREFYDGKDKFMFTSPASLMLETASSLFAGESNYHEVLDGLAVKYATMLNEADVKRLEGLVRRCKLLGTEMEFQTVTIDVKQLTADAGDKEDFDVMAWVDAQPVNKLDLKSLEGKVVLIDCWATWCGPCLAEVPNMMKQYELYHDKGFEIIGYSCDRDVKALLEFLIKEKPPWIIGSTILSGKVELKDYLNFYGVSGIPTMMLIGRDGKVLSIKARGETLNKLLEEQFK
jgi:thiol-disulfide isomerase/thioredoxin